MLYNTYLPELEGKKIEEKKETMEKKEKRMEDWERMLVPEIYFQFEKKNPIELGLVSIKNAPCAQNSFLPKAFCLETCKPGFTNFFFQLTSTYLDQVQTFFLSCLPLNSKIWNKLNLQVFIFFKNLHLVITMMKVIATILFYFFIIIIIKESFIYLLSLTKMIQMSKLSSSSPTLL